MRNSNQQADVVAACKEISNDGSTAVSSCTDEVLQRVQRPAATHISSRLPGSGCTLLLVRNAHTVLAEAPETQPRGASRTVLSQPQFAHGFGLGFSRHTVYVAPLAASVSGAPPYCATVQSGFLGRTNPDATPPRGNSNQMGSACRAVADPELGPDQASLHGGAHGVSWGIPASPTAPVGPKDAAASEGRAPQRPCEVPVQDSSPTVQQELCGHDGRKQRLEPHAQEPCPSRNPSYQSHGKVPEVGPGEDDGAGEDQAAAEEEEDYHPRRGPSLGGAVISGNVNGASGEDRQVDGARVCDPDATAAGGREPASRCEPRVPGWNPSVTSVRCELEAAVCEVGKGLSGRSVTAAEGADRALGRPQASNHGEQRKQPQPQRREELEVEDGEGCEEVVPSHSQHLQAAKEPHLEDPAICRTWRLHGRAPMDTSHQPSTQQGSSTAQTIPAGAAAAAAALVPQETGRRKPVHPQVGERPRRHRQEPAGLSDYVNELVGVHNKRQRTGTGECAAAREALGGTPDSGIEALPAVQPPGPREACDSAQGLDGASLLPQVTVRKDGRSCCTGVNDLPLPGAPLHKAVGQVLWLDTAPARPAVAAGGAAPAAMQERGLSEAGAQAEQHVQGIQRPTGRLLQARSPLDICGVNEHGRSRGGGFMVQRVQRFRRLSDLILLPEVRLEPRQDASETADDESDGSSDDGGADMDGVKIASATAAAAVALEVSGLGDAAAESEADAVLGRKCSGCTRAAAERPPASRITMEASAQRAARRGTHLATVMKSTNQVKVSIPAARLLFPEALSKMSTGAGQPVELYLAVPGPLNQSAQTLAPQGQAQGTAAAPSGSEGRADTVAQRRLRLERLNGVTLLSGGVAWALTGLKGMVKMLGLANCEPANLIAVPRQRRHGGRGSGAATGNRDHGGGGGDDDDDDDDDGDLPTLIVSRMDAAATSVARPGPALIAHNYNGLLTVPSTIVERLFPCVDVAGREVTLPIKAVAALPGEPELVNFQGVCLRGLFRRVVLSGLSPAMRRIGLRAGEQVALWRRTDGRVVLSRQEDALQPTEMCDGGPEMGFGAMAAAQGRGAGKRGRSRGRRASGGDSSDEVNDEEEARQKLEAPKRRRPQRRGEPDTAGVKAAAGDGAANGEGLYCDAAVVRGHVDPLQRLVIANDGADDVADLRGGPQPSPQPKQLRRQLPEPQPDGGQPMCRSRGDACDAALVRAPLHPTVKRSPEELKVRQAISEELTAAAAASAAPPPPQVADCSAGPSHRRQSVPLPVIELDVLQPRRVLLDAMMKRLEKPARVQPVDQPLNTLYGADSDADASGDGGGIEVPVDRLVFLGRRAHIDVVVGGGGGGEVTDADALRELPPLASTALAGKGEYDLAYCSGYQYGYLEGYEDGCEGGEAVEMSSALARMNGAWGDATSRRLQAAAGSGHPIATEDPATAVRDRGGVLTGTSNRAEALSQQHQRRPGRGSSQAAVPRASAAGGAAPLIAAPGADAPLPAVRVVQLLSGRAREQLREAALVTLCGTETRSPVHQHQQRQQQQHQPQCQWQARKYTQPHQDLTAFEAPAGPVEIGIAELAAIPVGRVIFCSSRGAATHGDGTRPPAPAPQHIEIPAATVLPSVAQATVERGAAFQTHGSAGDIPCAARLVPLSLSALQTHGSAGEIPCAARLVTLSLSQPVAAGAADGAMSPFHRGVVQGLQQQLICAGMGAAVAAPTPWVAIPVSLGTVVQGIPLQSLLAGPMLGASQQPLGHAQSWQAPYLQSHPQSSVDIVARMRSHIAELQGDGGQLDGVSYRMDEGGNCAAARAAGQSRAEHETPLVRLRRPGDVRNWPGERGPRPGVTLTVAAAEEELITLRHTRAPGGHRVGGGAGGPEEAAVQLTQSRADAVEWW